MNTTARYLMGLLVTMLLLAAQGDRPTGSSDQALPLPGKLTAPWMAEAYARLPVSFEMNQGQADSGVKFLARLSGYRLLLTSTEAVLSLDQPIERANGKKNRSGPIRRLQSTVRMKLAAANADPKVEGLDLLAATTNYFSGSDPKLWRTNIPNYARVKFRDVYPGVDLVYHGAGRQLEYDFVLAPGADPGLIRLAFDGPSEIRINKQGDLALSTASGDVVLRKPAVWQDAGGKRKEIAGRYAISSSSEVGFELSGYDASAPLVIDPVLVYSTYVGGSGNDMGLGIAVDDAGNAYVTGGTNSIDFPITQGAFQRASGGAADVFVAKLNPIGTALVYSTYLGGSGQDTGGGIAVDCAGNAYVAGTTTSNNFPTTAGALQTAAGGGTADAFVTKLNATGSALVYSTYLGGSDAEIGYSIAVDSAGSSYVTGFTGSTDFPTTPGALQAAFGGGGTFHAGDAFVAKLDPAGGALVYSTYLGGSGEEEGLYIALDSAGNAYVTGRTDSPNFPVTPGAFLTVGGGRPFDDGYAFAAKLNPKGTALVYSTYLVQMFDYTALGIAVDSAGNAYVAGNVSGVSANLSTTPGAFQTAFRGGRADGFVLRLNATGTGLVYSTYLGGNGEDAAQRIAVDRAGNAYVTGYTESTDFPGTSGALDAFSGFVTVLNAAGTTLVYSVKVDGASSIALDPSGNAYVTAFASVAKIGPQSSPTAPSFPAAGAVNAASFLPGAVSPGEFITIFGVGFGPPALATLHLLFGLVDTSLAGTRVLFDGVAAPMIYVVQNQLSAIVPYSVAGKAVTQVQVEYGFTKSSPVTLQVAPSSPGIFTVNSSGKGQGAILNQDYSVNSAGNPASVGSIVQIFATGEGQTKPPGRDGSLAATPLPAPVLTVSVKIGGLTAEVPYAGAAPGLVAGVLQVNAKVPAGAAAGSAVPVTITVGTVTSPSGVTLAIQRPALSPATWSTVGSMLVPRRDHTATLLTNGNVLIVGWDTTTAELYDPVSGTFSPTGKTLANHGQRATATRLTDGRVLVVGGTSAQKSAEIYAPSAGTFIPTGAPTAGHASHTATLLPDGRVLIADTVSELYDPAAGTFVPTGGMIMPRSGQTATLLSSGKVLIAGGARLTSPNSVVCADSAEVYDPVRGTFNEAIGMKEARCGHWAVSLLSGKVLVGGGLLSASAELFDPATGLFTLTGTMTKPRGDATATLLPNGQALIAGGYTAAGPVTTNSAELYDPVSGTFAATVSMATARQEHTATLLPSGQVLATGGYDGTGSRASASAELFSK